MLCNFRACYVISTYLNFPVFLPLLISVLKEDAFYDFSLLKLIKTYLWPNQLFWGMLYVYLRRMGILLLSVLNVSVRSRWFMVLLDSYFSLLMFCLYLLCFIESGVFKLPTIIVALSVSLFILSVFVSYILGICLLFDIYDS